MGPPEQARSLRRVHGRGPHRLATPTEPLRNRSEERSTLHGREQPRGLAHGEEACQAISSSLATLGSVSLVSVPVARTSAAGRTDSSASIGRARAIASGLRSTMTSLSARAIARAYLPTFTLYWRRLRLWRRLAGRDPGDIFAEIHQQNAWADAESASGPGSRLDRTASVRNGLPQLVREYQWRTLLDIPCGDFNWMKDTPLDLDYLGADIVEELIAKNQERYGSTGRAFRRLDLTRNDLPRVDAILCRDCLVHLSFAHIRAGLRNIRGPNRPISLRLRSLSVRRTVTS